MKHTLLRSSRLLLRTRTPASLSSSASSLRPLAAATATATTPSRSFTSAPRHHKGILPDSSNPPPPKTESHPASPTPAQLSDAQYHETADRYLDTLVQAAEEHAETHAADGIEVEFSAGVLTITTPNGTYVLNKQPPNKQIWLSSPVSGPKRYDWVVLGSGQHEKEGSALDTGDDGAGGRWVYLRDGSELTELLRRELGINVAAEGAPGEEA